MSIHSLSTLETAYKGYHIDQNGSVTEFYDHRNDALSSVATASTRAPLVSNSAHNHVAQPPPPRRKKQTVRYRSAGCCDGCVNVLITIGNLPFGTAFALICCWAGTAMVMGGGIAAMHSTLDLFRKYGPTAGNPATDPAPEYIFTSGQFQSDYTLRDINKLGNRVPQVFQAIEYALYGLVPFMLIVTMSIACDNHYSKRSITRKAKQSYKTKSTGICCTAGLIAIVYILIVFWIVWLCFTTLGVYYYRISMLRCYDLYEREYTEGSFPSICIDLVQMGLTMFQNTNDPGFGKICGPGDNMRTFGHLDDYCGPPPPGSEYPLPSTTNTDGYFTVYQLMLVAFSGCMLNIIGLINFIMMLSINYSALTRRHLYAPTANTTSAAGSSRPVPPRSSPPRSARPPTSPSPPPYIVPAGRDIRVRASRDDLRRGSRDDLRRGSRDDLRRGSRDDLRRMSRDIELEYMDGTDSSTVFPRREDDSNMGVNYYYRNR